MASFRIFSVFNDGSFFSISRTKLLCLLSKKCEFASRTEPAICHFVGLFFIPLEFIEHQQIFLDDLRMVFFHIHDSKNAC